eukprot:sb/3476500/
MLFQNGISQLPLGIDFLLNATNLSLIGPPQETQWLCHYEVPISRCNGRVSRITSYSGGSSEMSFSCQLDPVCTMLLRMSTCCLCLGPVPLPRALLADGPKIAVKSQLVSRKIRDTS